MSLTGNITISFRSTRVTQTFSMQFLGFKNRTDYTAATSSMPPSIWPICPQEPTCVARLSSKKSSSYCSIREKIKTKGSRYRPVILRSEPVDDIEYFVTLLRYIHQNPLKAGITENINDYPWSSWKDYSSDKCPASFCSTRTVFARISQTDLMELINTPIEDDGQILDIDTDGYKSVSDRMITRTDPMISIPPE